MWMITSSSFYPLSVLTGSHIDFVSLRVLAMPGLYLRDKSNCLSLDQTSAFTPFCLIMCQDLSSQVSPHSQISLYNMSFGRTLQMAYLSTDPPTWNVTNMTAQHTCKNIHKLTYNIITLWRRECTHWHTNHESILLKKHCAILNKTHSSITIVHIINVAMFVNIITISWEQNRTPTTIKTPVLQLDVVKSQMKLKTFRWALPFLQMSLFCLQV